MLIPVGLPPADVVAQHLLERTVRSLGLPVCLRMIRSTHDQLRTELRPQRTPEVGRESRITITQYRLGYTVQATHLAHEQLRQLRCGDRCGRRDVVYHLRELIDEHDDGIITELRAR